MLARSRGDLGKERRMKLAASHCHRHHVVQLHLRHQRAHEFLSRIHNVKQIDASFNAKVIEDGHCDFGGNVAGASSQAVERGVDEAGAATNGFYAIGNGKLEIAVAMEPQFALATSRAALRYLRT